MQSASTILKGRLIYDPNSGKYKIQQSCKQIIVRNVKNLPLQSYVNKHVQMDGTFDQIEFIPSKIDLIYPITQSESIPTKANDEYNQKKSKDCDTSIPLDPSEKIRSITTKANRNKRNDKLKKEYHLKSRQIIPLSAPLLRKSKKKVGTLNDDKDTIIGGITMDTALARTQRDFKNSF